MKLSDCRQLLVDDGFEPDGKTDYQQVDQILKSNGIKLANTHVWKLIHSFKQEITEVEDDL